MESDVAYIEKPFSVVFKRERFDADHIDGKSVVCETLVSAISPGTELAAYVGAAPLHPRVAYPRLVGYCNVARVLACGADVVRVNPGDRILSFTSHRSHFILPEKQILAVLNDDIDDSGAACAYLFHLGYNALLKADVRLGSPVVVIGLGVIGLGTVALAALGGANVFAISDHEKPRKIALEFGARRVFRRSELDALLALLGDRLADAVVTTTNSWDDWQIALRAAGMQGCISVLGFPGRNAAIPPFNPLESQYFYSKQLRIVAAGMSPEQNDERAFLKFNERDNLGFLLNLMNAGRLQPQRVISASWKASELALAYEALQSRHNSPLTFVLTWK